ncbi:MAG: hypothetical protein M1812_000979 [Candelaria pacifica]|nr:MAG: hypothetical protein M1812_000979 [Candelaria pacifica]
MPLPMPPSFLYCPEEEALCYWFLNFVMLPRHPDSISGFMEHLLPMYQNAKVDSQLSLITSATALSALGKGRGMESLMPKAYKMYSRALVAVKKAINDPVEAKKDETLMTVMLMSLYEVVNMPRQANDHHTDGAVALVKYRGEEQLQSEMSRNLLQAVRTQMVINCIQRQKPIEILPGHTEWIANIKHENAANSLTILTARLPELRLTAQNIFYSSINNVKAEDVQALRDAAAQMDVSIAEWAEDLPEAWSYEAVAHAEAMPDDLSVTNAFPGEIDVYQDLYIANVWNTYRIARFFVLSILMDSICWLASVPEYQEGTEFLETLAIVKQLVNEICASVPFHLCYRTSSAAYELQYPHSIVSDSINSHQPSTRTLGAYFLLLPLEVLLNNNAGMHPYRQWNYISAEQKTWLEGRMAYVRRLCTREFDQFHRA